MQEARHTDSLRTSALHEVVNYTLRPLFPGVRIPVSIGYEAVWAPQLIWTFWRGEKSLAPTATRTPDLSIIRNNNYVRILTR